MESLFYLMVMKPADGDSVNPVAPPAGQSATTQHCSARVTFPSNVIYLVEIVSFVQNLAHSANQWAKS